MASALPFQMSGNNAPGTTSVGGLTQIKSLKQTLSDEQTIRNAYQENTSSYIQGLSAHIRKCWMNAKLAKEMTVEQRMLKSIRQRRGEYDPDILAQILEQGGSTIYMMLASNKCRSAASWLRDVLLDTSDEKPWTLAPAPVPELSPDIVAASVMEGQQQIQQMYQQGQNPSDAEVRELLMSIKDMAVAQQREIAEADAARMEAKMQTQFLEGGWVRALSDFIDDVVTFPSAIIKGPVVRKKPKMKWEKGGPSGYQLQIEDTLVLEWDRVDPFMAYPAPDATSVDDGYFIERHKLARSDLRQMIDVEGYSNGAILGVLDDYGRGGLREWLYVDTAKATAEGKSTFGVMQNASELIDALQFWGPVQGKLLREWGVPEDQVPDELEEYQVEAWLIGHWVIKAVVNPDPLGRKPYYKASYEEVPGAFWGNSVNDLCRDSQNMCNATARALANNMGLASGPQVVYNVDRLPKGENITQLFPWKIWQTTSDPQGGTQPPMQFFQPNSMAQELLLVYDKFSVLADEYTGIPRYMTGDSPAGGAGRTASGMSMLMSNAGKSIKQVIAAIDEHVIKPSVDRLYFYNMQFSDDVDLKGDINIVARGATALMVREAAHQRQMEFLQITAANPVVGQIVGNEGVAEIIRNVAKDLALNTDKIVAPMPILRKRWADAAAQQAAMAQQQLNFQRDDNGQVTGAHVGPPPGVLPPRTAPPASPQNTQDQRHLMNGAPMVNNFNPMKG